MSEVPDVGLALVADHLARQGGPPLGAYKDRCLRRRLAVRMRACGVESLQEYAALLAGSETETGHLLEALTINVTEFFRNPEVWDRLTEVLPPLLAGHRGGFRAWSAGCASGEEPYSLALLLAGMPHGRAGATPIGPLIDATDIDVGSLDRARNGRYAAATALKAECRVPGLERVGREVVVVPDIKAAVHFEHRDLLQQPPPNPPYDLILCRNVIIYFEREAQERLFDVFAEALAPGGLLVLGRVETVSGPRRASFEMLFSRERIYRKLA